MRKAPPPPTQRWTLPLDRNETGFISFSTNFVGIGAREIRRAVRFIRATHVAPVVALSVDGGPAILLNFDGPGATAPEEAFTQFIDDVCVLEDHFELDLRLPPHIDNSDLIWARIMRMLIQGLATAHPHNGTFGGTLDGTSDPALDGLISEGRAAVVRQKGFGIDFFGEVLEIDEIFYYAPHVLVDDADAIQQAFHGTAEGLRIALRPIDGLPWVIYAPTFVERAGHETVLTHPWSITGVDEHPGFMRLPNRVHDHTDGAAGTPALS